MTEEELRAELQKTKEENVKLCRLVFELTQRLTAAAALIEKMTSERKVK